MKKPKLLQSVTSPKSVGLLGCGPTCILLLVCSFLLLLLLFKVQIDERNSAGCQCGTAAAREAATSMDGGGGVAPAENEEDFVSDWHLLGKSRNTERILEQIRRNGTTPCHHETTATARFEGLPTEGSGKTVRIPTDEMVRFKLVSLTAEGKERCAGGDYYEVDLEGEHWRSRPEVRDMEDGSYEVGVMVDGSKEGVYNLTARILFGNLHGLDHETAGWRRSGEVAAKLQMVAERKKGGAMKTKKKKNGVVGTCREEDMVKAGGGGGRWTRGEYNRSCEANGEDGRWQCLKEGSGMEICEEPWCTGKVSDLESNGWVYSDKTCSFHIFSKEEAWECLAGRWIFMWGDSNMLDFLRNLLIFGLAVPPPPWANISTWEMNRVVEQPLFVNPSRPDQALRVSFVFNGHYLTMGDWLGLDSLHNSSYRHSLRSFFNGSSSHPDTFVFNTGLHDGLHFRHVQDFARAVSYAADFWLDVLRPLLNKKQRRPPPSKIRRGIRLLLRTTVAPAGPARWNKSNPQKMEAYNAILLEGFRKRFRGMHVIDAFDASFPFHYDFSHSDGGHYGRPPGIRRWPWFDKPHHYFVEVMLVHMMLNSICAA